MDTRSPRAGLNQERILSIHFWHSVSFPGTCGLPVPSQAFRSSGVSRSSHSGPSTSRIRWGQLAHQGAEAVGLLLPEGGEEFVRHPAAHGLDVVHVAPHGPDPLPGGPPEPGLKSLRGPVHLVAGGDPPTSRSPLPLPGPRPSGATAGPCRGSSTTCSSSRSGTGFPRTRTAAPGKASSKIATRCPDQEPPPGKAMACLGSPMRAPFPPVRRRRPMVGWEGGGGHGGIESGVSDGAGAWMESVTGNTPSRGAGQTSGGPRKNESAGMKRIRQPVGYATTSKPGFSGLLPWALWLRLSWASLAAA